MPYSYKKLITSIFLLIITMIGVLFSFYLVKRSYIYKSIDAYLIKDTIEYGEAVNEKDLIEYTGRYVTIQNKIDTNTIGKQNIEYVVYDIEDMFKSEVKKAFDFEVNVVDTNYPIIEIDKEEVSVYVNSEYDLKDNVLEVYDVIDDDIDYTVEADVDFRNTGSYTVNIIAKDKNNLVSKKKYDLIVKNRPVLSVNDGYYYIDNYLNNVFGFNKAARCAILANIKFESTFNPTVDGYYYGLIQWGGSRKDNLYAYCNNNGYDYSSYDGQLQFMYYELVNNYPSVYNYLNNLDNTASGAFDGAVYFCEVYEGAATSAGRGELAYNYFESEP